MYNNRDLASSKCKLCHQIIFVPADTTKNEHICEECQIAMEDYLNNIADGICLKCNGRCENIDGTVCDECKGKGIQ